MTLGIIGLGLMGGSFSLALKQKNLFNLHIGYDENQFHEKKALDLNIVDSIVDYETVIRSSDVLILAVPVSVIVKIMPDLLKIKKGAVVIDLGSTKGVIAQAVPSEIRENFVLAHPMAGTEYSGPAAAFSSLYKNKVCVLCDMEKSSERSKERAIEIFKALEMKFVFMESKEHDRHAAFISHLPHMISYGLANTVLKEEDKESILTLAAGGFKDMSRLAKSSPSMWEDIFRQNREELLITMEKFKDELRYAKKLLQEKEYEPLAKWMEEANKLHDIFKSA